MVRTPSWELISIKSCSHALSVSARSLQYVWLAGGMQKVAKLLLQPTRPEYTL